MTDTSTHTRDLPVFLPPQPGRATRSEVVVTPLRDGTELLARVVTDADGAPRPVLLVRTPYGEAMSRTLPVQGALDAGFAVMVQQCRGTCGSGGQLRTFENERNDGLDTLEWLRAQPFCDGRIVMFGHSYLGMTQMAVVGDNPPGLKAISPVVTPHDYRDGLVFRQGVFQLGQAVSWHLLKSAEVLHDLAGRGHDVAGVAADFGKLAASPAAFEALPVGERPVFAELIPSWRSWIEAENDPAYWAAMSYRQRRSAARVPALHVGGWFDLFLSGTLENFRDMAAHGPHQHLIVGPWVHGDYGDVTGELHFPGAAGRAIGLEQLQLRFLRAAVDDEPLALPAVQVYVMGANRWRTFDHWPPAEAQHTRWYLHTTGRLSTEPPASEATPLEWVHDPRDPVPTVGGSSLIAGGIGGRPSFAPGPRDQRLLDHRRDILRFTTPPLTEAVEVVGEVTVTAHVTAEAFDGDLVARLIDVYPDGRAMGVTDGIVRLRYRNGMDDPQPLKPGEVVEVTVDLVGTAHAFREGHRIRVDIAGSDFPKYDRNSGTAKPVAEVTEADLRPFTQRIYFDATRPSYLTLPVVSAPTAPVSA